MKQPGPEKAVEIRPGDIVGPIEGWSPWLWWMPRHEPWSCHPGVVNRVIGKMDPGETALVISVKPNEAYLLKGEIAGYVKISALKRVGVE